MNYFNIILIFVQHLCYVDGRGLDLGSFHKACKGTKLT